VEDQEGMDIDARPYEYVDAVLKRALELRPSELRQLGLDIHETVLDFQAQGRTDYFENNMFQFEEEVREKDIDVIFSDGGVFENILLTAPQDIEHTVEPNQSLSHLSFVTYGNDGLFETIREANPWMPEIKNTLDYHYPWAGHELVLPAAASDEHRILHGETLEGVAKIYYGEDVPKSVHGWPSWMRIALLNFPSLLEYKPEVLATMEPPVIVPGQRLKIYMSDEEYKNYVIKVFTEITPVGESSQPKPLDETESSEVSSSEKDGRSSADRGIPIAEVMEREGSISAEGAEAVDQLFGPGVSLSDRLRSLGPFFGHAGRVLADEWRARRGGDQAMLSGAELKNPDLVKGQTVEVYYKKRSSDQIERAVGKFVEYRDDFVLGSAYIMDMEGRPAVFLVDGNLHGFQVIGINEDITLITEQPQEEPVVQKSFSNQILRQAEELQQNPRKGDREMTAFLRQEVKNALSHRELLNLTIDRLREDPVSDESRYLWMTIEVLFEEQSFGNEGLVVTKYDYQDLWALYSLVDAQAGSVVFERKRGVVQAKKSLLNILSTILWENQIKLAGDVDKSLARDEAKTQIDAFYQRFLSETKGQRVGYMGDNPWVSFILRADYSFSESIIEQVKTGQEGKAPFYNELIRSSELLAKSEEGLSRYSRKTLAHLIKTQFEFDVPVSVQSSQAAWDVLFENEQSENHRKFFELNSLLRKIYPFRYNRNDSRPPFQFILEENVAFEIAPNLYVSPITGSFRSHMVFGKDEKGDVKFAFEVVMPGDLRTDVEVDMRKKLSEELLKAFPQEELSVKVLDTKIFTGFYDLYGKRYGFNDQSPLRILAREYKMENDGKRLADYSVEMLDLLAEELGLGRRDLDVLIAQKTAEAVTATHSLGYIGHWYKNNMIRFDMHIGNLRMIIDQNKIGKNQDEFIRFQYVADFTGFESVENFQDADFEREVDLSRVILPGTTQLPGLMSILPNLSIDEMFEIFRTTTVSVSDPKSQGILEIRGGIALNPDTLNLEMQGDLTVIDIPPFDPSQFEQIQIDGFTPVIIHTQPALNLPMLLGLADEKPESVLLSSLN